MKEMIYQANRKRELLDNGSCYGFEYFIMSFGMYPVAYIKIPKNHPFYKKEYDDICKECDIEVNGGLTFSEDCLWISETEKLDGWFIGWDYAHYGDYIGSILGLLYSNVTDGKKWTTEEIRQEVFNACKQLKEIDVQNEINR